jgi:hypothetical protein
MIKYIAPTWTYARWIVSGGDDAIAYGDLRGTRPVRHWSATFMRVDGLITPIVRVDGRDLPVGTYDTMHDALAATWSVLATASGKGV